MRGLRWGWVGWFIRIEVLKRGGEEVLGIGRGFQQREFGAIYLEIKGIL